MNNKIYSRNELLWKKEVQALLFSKHIAVFGLGGVGSYAAEALARSGIGKITIVDFDDISETNINRQLLALNSTVGKAKTILMQERIKDINPDIAVNAINSFCTAQLLEKIFDEPVDYVIDAIDTIKSKIELIETCHKRGIPVICSLGAGNRLDPEQLYTADISEIKPKKCVFAKNVLYRLRKAGITEGIAVVISKEPPIPIEKNLSRVEVQTESGENIEFNKFSLGSSPFVPPVAGYIMAGYAVRSFIKNPFSEK